MMHDTSNRTTARNAAGQAWGDAGARQRTDPCAEDCTPRCPACGGLKCLCRPRFFPGQLLTDEDLNRLEQYVIDKNRLHNRYLHGWGVACGLEVACDPCAGGHVLVRPGYAVSPCGDDIIVCAAQTVDICALISQCAPARPAVCDSPFDVPPSDCSGRARRWVLAICYDERLERGITAQLGMGDTTCGARCGCGCGAGPGCGCGKAGACTCGGPEAGGSAARRKTPNPQCEPTQVCEGYRFVAYPAPGLTSAAPPGRQPGDGNNMVWTWLYANRERFGPLLERVLCCLVRAMQLRSEIREGRKLDNVAALGVYTDYAYALREFAADFAQHRCAAANELARQYDEARRWTRELGARGQLSDEQQAALRARIEELDRGWIEVVSECLCSALLPACPPPSPHNCVPLAVVTVGGDTCRVSEICNWEARKHLITWPTIMYWFSWLPWSALRRWIARLCCGDERDQGAYRLLMLMLGTAMSALKSGAGNTGAARPATPAPAATSPHAGPPADPLAEAFDAPDLLAHMMGDFEALRRQGALSDLHPQWAALAARIADASALAPLAGTQAPGDLAATVAALERTAAEQQKQIAAQQQQIDELMRREPNRPTGGATSRKPK